MESRAKFVGHAVHPMLVAFPIGLLITAIVFDLVSLVTNDTRWASIAFYLIAAGVVGGVLAAPFGWIDWFGIPRGTRAKRIGLVHGVGNMVMLVLFALSWLLRRESIAVPPTQAVVAALAGAAALAITGWLGGELVSRLGVGVDDGAHLDSPSSLSALPATTDMARLRGDPTPSEWTGVERRVGTTPPYIGMERRRLPSR